MRLAAYILLLSVFLQGCGDKSPHSGFPSAGVITYAIDYPEEITNSPTGSLMPDKMTLSFRDQQIRYHFKGSFNVFSLDFYSPCPEDSCTTVFRFMDKKMLSKGSEDVNFFIFNEGTTPSVTIKKDGTKEIAGMTCRHGKVRFKGAPEIDIYFSDSINLRKPNRHTPFEKVPGVMLEFSVDYNGVRFHFVAEEVDFAIPEKAMFTVPHETKTSHQEEIEDLIVTLIKSFQ